VQLHVYSHLDFRIPHPRGSMCLYPIGCRTAEGERQHAHARVANYHTHTAALGIDGELVIQSYYPRALYLTKNPGITTVNSPSVCHHHRTVDPWRCDAETSVDPQKPNSLEIRS